MSDVLPASSKSVVIIGGGESGRTLAQKLVKTTNYRVTIVQQHDYFIVPSFAPFCISNPDAIDKWNTNKGIAASLDKVPLHDVVHEVGTVTAVDPVKKSLTVVDKKEHPSEHFYDILVIAVGISYPIISPPARLCDIEQLKHFYKEEFPKTVKNAKRVLVGGAGPVACEMVGTLRVLNPHCKIVMVSSGETAIPGWKGSMGGRAVQEYLEGRDVELIPNERLKEHEFSLVPGTYTLQNSGRNIEADIYLPYFGTSNTKFMPEGSCEGRSGKVLVKNNGQSSSHPEIFAIGCGSEVRMSFGDNIANEAEVVSKNIVAVLTSKPPAHLLKPKETKLGYMHFVWGEYSVLNPPQPVATCCRILGCPLCFFCPCCLVCGWNGCKPAGKLPSLFLKKMVIDGMGAPVLAPFKKLAAPQKSSSPEPVHMQR